jgi:probable HAF family extracellular repeat protein
MLALSLGRPTCPLQTSTMRCVGKTEKSSISALDGDACSRANAINSSGVIVGASTTCGTAVHAFVWHEGGPMLDLNKLIPSGSGLQLTFAPNINDRGEILARSVPSRVAPEDDEDLGHLVLLIPCDDDSPCKNSINSSAVST